MLQIGLPETARFIEESEYKREIDLLELASVEIALEKALIDTAY